MSDIKVRKSFPLTDDEVAELEAAQRPHTPQHQALLSLTGINATSDAATLRAWMLLGRKAMQELVDDISYRQEAEDTEDLAARTALRRRFIAKIASEEQAA